MVFVLRCRKKTEPLLHYNFQTILMASENINLLALSPGHLLNEERVLRISPSPTIRSSERDCEQIKVHNKILGIATWNVRSLYAAGKLANVERERHGLGIDILGLSKERWSGSGRMKDGYLHYSGGKDNEHRYRVAILVSLCIEKSVLNFIPHNDRAMMIRIRTSHKIMNVIQIYAPTNDKSDEDVEMFYNNIEELLKLTKKGEITRGVSLSKICTCIAELLENPSNSK